MGRHAAPVAVDALAVDTPAPADPVARSRSDAWTPDNPVTDPRLFDAPLPAATVERPAAVNAPAAPLQEQRAAAAPTATRTLPATALAFSSTGGLREIRRSASTLTTTPSLEVQTQRPVAAFGPDAGRTAAPAAVLPWATPTEIGVAVARKPAGTKAAHRSRSVAAMPLSAPSTGVSPALRRGRAVPLSICAVAVLGAVSAAAVVLPTGRSSAEPADRHVGTDTNSIPVLPAAATTANAKAKAPALKASHDNGRHLGQLKRATTATTTGPRPTAGRAADPILRPRASSTSTVTPASTQTSPTPTQTAAPNPTATSTATPTLTQTSTPTPTPTRTATPPSVATGGTALRSIVGGAGNGSLLSLPSARYVVKDFAANLMAVDLQNRGLKGAGVDKTVIELAAHSSTKAGNVPTAAYTTNQLYLLSTIGGTPGLSGFTLKATSQGHLYNGLRIGKAVNARVHDVKVESIPGNASFPPGETFVLNDWRTDGSVYSRVTIDGGGVAAAGFGTNSSKNVTINDSTFTGAAYSSGAAMWQTTNITMNDVRIVNNRSGINFERSGGTIKLVRPVFKNNAKYDMQFGTDLGGGTVTIVDPVLAPGQKLRLNVPANYHGHVNGQKRSNIHVIVNGVDRTKDLIQYL